VIGTDGSDDRALAPAESPDVTYGLPEHVAAESMGRHRGYWWSPDGDRLAVARVDNSPVQTWHLADPSRPEAPPMARRYPPAGTDNADVSLWVVGLDGSRVEVRWDRDAFEYLVEVLWDRHGLFVVVQDRAQHELRVLAVVAATGATTEVARVTDPAWTQIVPGVPTHLADGSLVWTADDDRTRRLTVDGTPVTPGGLQVAEVLGVDGDTVLFVGSREPTEEHLFLWSPEAGPVQLTHEPGRHSGRRSAGLTVITSSTLGGHEVTVHGDEVFTVVSSAAGSPVVPRVTLMNAGRRELRTAVLFPTGWQGERLPVLMDPYGGPAAQRAMADRDFYWASQWFADQGFAVIVADGRGTPGRGPAWEREIHLNRSDALLEDQIEALHAVAAAHPEIDLSRVGIRGWSAGGYLAALAVLRRPDVFHAAVAGAPVTDHLLYDTHWQERFLGDPRVDPGPYRRASLIDDAPKLARPLMLIHGLLDDNVYPVHTMRLSAALFAAGRPHTVLPLPGASHMAPDADLLTPQLDFLRAALG
jgi:dipeptidyl-peptidase-4